jgi:hypothetical protein
LNLSVKCLKRTNGDMPMSDTMDCEKMADEEAWGFDLNAYGTCQTTRSLGPAKRSLSKYCPGEHRRLMPLIVA